MPLVKGFDPRSGIVRGMCAAPIRFALRRVLRRSRGGHQASGIRLLKYSNASAVAAVRGFGRLASEKCARDVSNRSRTCPENGPDLVVGSA